MSSFGDKRLVVAVETSRMNLLQRCLRLDRIFPSWTGDDDEVDNRDAQRGRWHACAEFFSLVCGRFGCDVYMLDSQSHDRDPANNVPPES